jgi:hypothetical protein
MSKAIIITISEDVINAVLKPASFLLNDHVKNTSFTHVMPKDAPTHYDMSEDGKTPIFTFASSEGGRFKFTMYDLRRFHFAGKSFLDSIRPVHSVTAVLALDFKVLACEPTYVKGKGKELPEADRVISYPPFCFEYWETYERLAEELKAKNAKDKTKFKMPQSERDTLYASAIKEGFEDKFYRILTLDVPLFSYPPKTK